MIKRWSPWALTLLLAASCGSGVKGAGGHGGSGGATGGTGGVLCIPGASVSCTCTDGRQGAQLCNSDGRSLASCVCSGGGGGAGGTSGIGGSVGGNGGTSGGGTTGIGGTGASCQGSLPPEIRFGAIGQGDVNPSFQSAVGALGTNVMYVFSGFTSSGSQAVYVQAFEPKTGASKGPAQSLFSPPTLGFESASYVGGSVYLFAAAVADTGDIALAYQLTNSATSNAALYVAFLSPPTANDGGVQGLQLQHVELVSTSFIAAAVANDPKNPKLFWSNASRTFVLNYVSRAAQQPLPSTTALQISVAKYRVSGQSAGGISSVPVPTSFSDTSPSQRVLIINGSVGESGNTLGVQYAGSNGLDSRVALTTLDEDATPVGTPAILGSPTPHTSLMEVAGTAKGFVCTYFGSQYVNVVFVPTSAGSGNTDGGVGGGFSGLMSMSGTNAFGRALADDVGTGGKDGVGLVLGTAVGIVFGYVNSDGTAIEGPTQVFPADAAGALSMTTFNGRFAISTYDATAHSARVVASGVCP